MINQAICASFEQELYSAVHDILGGDTIKMALYTSDASLGRSTTEYTETGEVTDDGYTAGGVELSSPVLSKALGVLTLTFANVSIDANITARGALIYNSSKSNKAIAVLDFGHDKTANPFTVTF